VNIQVFVDFVVYHFAKHTKQIYVNHSLIYLQKNGLLTRQSDFTGC